MTQQSYGLDPRAVSGGGFNADNTLAAARQRLQTARDSGNVAPRVLDAWQDQLDRETELVRQDMRRAQDDTVSALAERAETNLRRLAAFTQAAERLQDAWQAGTLPATPRTRRALATLTEQIQRAEQLHAEHRRALERWDAMEEAGPDGWDRVVLGSSTVIAGLRAGRFSF